MFLDKEGIKEFLLKHKIQLDNGCWILSTRHRKRYQYYRSIGIHRLSMWIFKDFDLNSGLLILHKCDNPPCWNPDHLSSGTQIDNKEDQYLKGRIAYTIIKNKPLFCKRGHEFTIENTYKNAGGRRCKTCRDNYYRDVTSKIVVKS